MLTGLPVNNLRVPYLHEILKHMLIFLLQNASQINVFFLQQVGVLICNPIAVLSSLKDMCLGPTKIFKDSKDSHDMFSAGCLTSNLKYLDTSHQYVHEAYEQGSLAF